MGYKITLDLEDLTTVQEAMCDDFCIYAQANIGQEALDEQCNKCPLNNIRDYEYPYGRNDWQE